jgi:hypothetical protein
MDRAAGRTWSEVLQALQSKLKARFAVQYPGVDILGELLKVEIDRDAPLDDGSIGADYFNNIAAAADRKPPVHSLIAELNEGLRAYFRSPAGQSETYLVSVTDNPRCRRLQIDMNPLEQRFVFAKDFTPPTPQPDWRQALQALRDTLRADLPRNQQELADVA